MFRLLDSRIGQPEDCGSNPYLGIDYLRFFVLGRRFSCSIQSHFLEASRLRIAVHKSTFNQGVETDLSDSDRLRVNE